MDGLAPTLSVERVTDPPDPRVEGVLSLYREAIPAWERKPDAAIRTPGLKALDIPVCSTIVRAGQA